MRCPVCEEPTELLDWCYYAASSEDRAMLTSKDVDRVKVDRERYNLRRLFLRKRDN
jgi:hypothetical protein